MGGKRERRTIGIELTVTFSSLHGKIMRPSCQSCTTLMFLKSGDQIRYLIRTISMNIFIKMTQGS